MTSGVLRKYFFPNAFTEFSNLPNLPPLSPASVTCILTESGCGYVTEPIEAPSRESDHKKSRFFKFPGTKGLYVDTYS